MNGWTKEVPTESGWYWHCYADRSTPTAVLLSNAPWLVGQKGAEMRAVHMRRWNSTSRTARELRGWWYGPIEVPPRPLKERKVLATEATHE